MHRRVETEFTAVTDVRDRWANRSRRVRDYITKKWFLIARNKSSKTAVRYANGINTVFCTKSPSQSRGPSPRLGVGWWIYNRLPDGLERKRVMIEFANFRRMMKKKKRNIVVTPCEELKFCASAKKKTFGNRWHFKHWPRSKISKDFFMSFLIFYKRICFFFLVDLEHFSPI